MIGDKVIGHASQQEIDNQNKFVTALTPGGVSHVKHLTLLGCKVGQDKTFLEKLRRELGADQVTAYTGTIWLINNNLFVEDGVKNPVVGGIVLDPADTGALQLQTHSSSGSDAWLLAEVIAGTAATAMVLGGVWYARRRRVQ